MLNSRLQKLAGIKVPVVELHASYLPGQFNKDNPSSNGQTGRSVKEKKHVVLCSLHSFTMFSDDPDELDNEVGGVIPYTDVTFKKPLNEVYLDYDDSDPTEFGQV